MTLTYLLKCSAQGMAGTALMAAAFAASAPSASASPVAERLRNSAPEEQQIRAVRRAVRQEPQQPRPQARSERRARPPQQAPQVRAERHIPRPQARVERRVERRIERPSVRAERRTRPQQTGTRPRMGSVIDERERAFRGIDDSKPRAWTRPRPKLDRTDDIFNHSEERRDQWEDRQDRREDRREDRWDDDNDDRTSHHRWRGDRHDRYDWRDYRRWDRWGWRSNHRYDWRYYRARHHSLYRLGRYYPPYRYGHYNRIDIGFFLGSLFFGNRYWIDDPWYYRLPDAYGPYRWVRYYDDVLLVNIYTGEVVDVIYGFFW